MFQPNCPALIIRKRVVEMAILEASAALVVVVTMIWLGARVITLTGLGRKPQSGGRTLSIDETLAVDSQRRLLVVSCGPKRVLLMIGGRQDLVLGWLDADKE